MVLLCIRMGHAPAVIFQCSKSIPLVLWRRHDVGGRIIVKRVGDGPLWAIGSTYYSPAVVEHAKAVPGMTYNNPPQSWHGYADAVTAVVARLATKNIRCVGADELPEPDSWRTARTPYLFATSG